jgi:hypothetical protein
VTAQAYDRSLAGAPAVRPQTRGFGGVALVVVLVVLMTVAFAVLATAAWIAPAAPGAVPG